MKRKENCTKIIMSCSIRRVGNDGDGSAKGFAKGFAQCFADGVANNVYVYVPCKQDRQNDLESIRNQKKYISLPGIVFN